MAIKNFDLKKVSLFVQLDSPRIVNFFFVLAIDPQGYMVYRMRRKAKFSNLLAPL